MKTIKLYDKTGAFCENKDIAKELREKIIMPTLAKRGSVTIDFDGVSGATQSFIHALVSDAIREYQEYAFDNLFYKNANPDIQKIISIVYTYMQSN